MVTEVKNNLCGDCLKRKTCEYVPTGARLLRCLDRQTAQVAENPQPHYRQSVSDADPHNPSR